MIRKVACPIMFTSVIVLLVVSLFFPKTTLSSPALTTHELGLELIPHASGSDGRTIADSIAAKNNCTDIDGDWEYSTRGTVKCSYEGQTDKETVRNSGTVNIRQNGCKISWKVDSYTRNGQLSGKTITVTGKFAVALVSGVKISQNTYTAKGTLKGNKFTMSGSGKVTGSYQGVSFSCEGTDKTVFTSSNYDKYMKTTKKRNISVETSLPCLDGILKILP